MSKKTILTPAQRDAVPVLARTLGQGRIALRLGIAPCTLNRMFARDPELRASYENAKSEIIEDMTETLIQKALAGDTLLMMFYLKTQAQWRQGAVKIQIKKTDSIQEVLNKIIKKMVGDGETVELDNATLGTLNALIRTKIDIDDLQELQKRITLLENK